MALISIPSAACTMHEKAASNQSDINTETPPSNSANATIPSSPVEAASNQSDINTETPPSNSANATTTSSPIEALFSRTNDNLLAQYESSDRQFERYEIGDKIVYWHQRKIGDAIVELDYINYQFDKYTKQLLKKITHWRTDLPESLPPIAITKEQAISMVNVESAELIFISPESYVFPIKPTPVNPCWVVRSIDGGNMTIKIIDAVTGKTLGFGVPPP